MKKRLSRWRARISPNHLTAEKETSIKSPKAHSVAFLLVLLLGGCSGPRPEAKPRAEPQVKPTVTKDSARSGSLLEGAHRIVFLGDSITYSGQYIDDLSMVLLGIGEESHFEFLNLGLPSETVSGLTEPGHANGSFPRPDLHERLERLLDLTRPDLVIACYGMNDGIYYPFDPAKFEKFQQGIRLLRERVERAHARVILVTPPVFDPLPIRNRTLPAGLAEYRQPYEGYNYVLDRYSEWLLQQRTNGWIVIDIHFPMKDYLQQRRLKEPSFALAADGVHLNDTGHWLVAQAIQHGLKVPVSSASAVIELKAGASAGIGETKEFRKHGGEVAFIWVTRPPMPLIGFKSTYFPPQGQAYSIIAHHGDFATYRLFAEDQLLATVSRQMLDSGFDMRQFNELITVKRGRQILELIHSRNRILSDAWLTLVGHKRPGMTKGLPVKQAEIEATSLGEEIRELRRPVEVHLRLVPQAPE